MIALSDARSTFWGDQKRELLIPECMMVAMLDGVACVPIPYAHVFLTQTLEHACTFSALARLRRYDCPSILVDASCMTAKSCERAHRHVRTFD